MRYAPLEGIDTGAPPRHRVQGPLAPQARADPPLLRPRGPPTTPRRATSAWSTSATPSSASSSPTTFTSATPAWPRGRLTALRSGLVRSATLASVAAELDLGHRLYLGHGEETSGGRVRERKPRPRLRGRPWRNPARPRLREGQAVDAQAVQGQARESPARPDRRLQVAAPGTRASRRQPAACLPHRQGGRPPTMTATSPSKSSSLAP